MTWTNWLVLWVASSSQYLQNLGSSRALELQPKKPLKVSKHESGFFSLQIFSEGWRRLYTGLALLVSACLQRMHWSLLNIKKFFFTCTCSRLRHTFWCFFGSFNCLLTFSHHLVVEHWYNLPILFYYLRLFVSSGYYSCIWFSASSLISFFYHGKHSTGELSR